MTIFVLQGSVNILIFGFLAQSSEFNKRQGLAKDPSSPAAHMSADFFPEGGKNAQTIGMPPKNRRKQGFLLKHDKKSKVFLVT